MTGSDYNMPCVLLLRCIVEIARPIRLLFATSSAHVGAIYSHGCPIHVVGGRAELRPIQSLTSCSRPAPYYSDASWESPDRVSAREAPWARTLMLSLILLWPFSGTYYSLVTLLTCLSRFISGRQLYEIQIQAAIDSKVISRVDMIMAFFPEQILHWSTF
jgi:hypothetical protein